MADEGEQASSDVWGDDISDDRKAELEQRLQAWQQEADHGEKLGPLARFRLTGADVFWLAARSLAGSDDESAITTATARLNIDGWPPVVSELHLELANLQGAHLEGASLRGAHLELANLGQVHLGGADLREAHLERADLRGAYLEGADLADAHLEGRRFAAGDADLTRIQGWVSDFPVDLPPADLRLAYFDRATQLTKATLGTADLGYVRVADTRWGEANLAVVDWSDSPVLQDERAATEWKPPETHAREGKRPTRRERREAQRKQNEQRLDLFLEATRANRQLAAVLRDQGLNDEADKFAYRAQVLQRTVLRLQGRRGAAIGSWLLDLVSGYGYQPVRSVIAYVVIILFFAALYQVNGQFAAPHLHWDEALVLSISSFHGRGFFTTGINLSDTLARLAAGEVIIGLLIEIVFIATFTQRFFSR